MNTNNGLLQYNTLYNITTSITVCLHVGVYSCTHVRVCNEYIKFMCGCQHVSV